MAQKKASRLNASLPAFPYSIDILKLGGTELVVSFHRKGAVVKTAKATVDLAAANRASFSDAQAAARVSREETQAALAENTGAGHNDGGTAEVSATKAVASRKDKATASTKMKATEAASSKAPVAAAKASHAKGPVPGKTTMPYKGPVSSKAISASTTGSYTSTILDSRRRGYMC